MNKPEQAARTRIDFTDLADALLGMAETLVPQWLPGRRNGHEWQGEKTSKGGPGDSWSVNLKTGMWAHFSGNESGGDLISLYAAIFGKTQIEAARELAKDFGISSVRSMPASPVAPKPEKSRSEWAVVTPVPSFAPARPKAHPHRGVPAMVWEYRIDGQLYGYVCRFVTSDGGKETLPLTWCQNEADGSMRWHWKSWDVPRPLYMPTGRLRSDAVVVVVEGEKCAEKLAEQLPEFDVVSWPGGSKVVSRANWAPLAGKRVILWGDADSLRVPLTPAEKAEGGDPSTKPYLPAIEQPGHKAMDKAATILAGEHGCDVFWLAIAAPGEMRDGWDCADAIDGIGVDAPWSAEQLQAHLRTAKRWVAPLEVQNEAAKAANKAADTTYTPVPASAGEEEGGGVIFGWPHYAKTGPKATRENILHALRKDVALRGLVGLNEFSHKVFKLRGTPWKSAEGEWTEVDDLKLGEYCVNRHGWSGSPSHEAIGQALKVVAHEHRFHPVRDKYEALAWDGELRLAHWLFDALGLDPFAMSEVKRQYVSAVGKWFLMGMVKRVMQPGCKFDYMLVLEGPQGYRKSTLGKVLAGKYFSDTHLDLGNKDSYLQLQGRQLHEFSEMHALNNKDVTLVKAFVSSQTDYLRAPFDKRPSEYPRQCVFYGTSNNSKWARDRTGNRRFWPIEVVTPVRTEWVEENLDQLLAEAVKCVRDDERCYPTQDEELAWFMPQQARRVQSTAVEEALFQYLTGSRTAKGPADGMAPDSVTLVGCLEGIGIDVAKAASNRMSQGEVTELLHKWGWVHKRSSKLVNGARPWMYMRPAVWPPVADIADDDFGNDRQAQAEDGVPSDIPF